MSECRFHLDENPFFFYPVILYACGKWCPTLREEHRVNGFKNRVLGKIFRPKREEVTGG
jgi:hypothetical protein